MEQIQTIVLDENIFFLNTLEKHLGNMDCVTVVTTSHYVSDLISKIRHLVPDLLIFNLDLHTINPLQFSEQVKKESPKSKIIAYANVDVNFYAKDIYPDIDEYLAQDELFETLYPMICRLFYKPVSQTAKQDKKNITKT
jgi:two-component SAPR family response regulator